MWLNMDNMDDSISYLLERSRHWPRQLAAGQARESEMKPLVRIEALLQSVPE